MATYLIGFKFTDKGLEHIKESPSRLENAKKVFRQAGSEVREFYLVMGGHYDTLLLVQAPNEEAVAKAVLQIDAMGTATSETCRAFSEDEFRKLVGSLP